MFDLILKIVVSAGLGFLAGLIIEVAVIKFSEVLDRIKKKLGVSGVKRMVVHSLPDFAKDFYKNIEKEANVYDIDTIRRWMESEGTIEALIDTEGNLLEDQMEIYEAERADETFKRVMLENNGVLIIEN